MDLKPERFQQCILWEVAWLTLCRCCKVEYIFQSLGQPLKKKKKQRNTAKNREIKIVKIIQTIKWKSGNKKEEGKK